MLSYYAWSGRWIIYTGLQARDSLSENSQQELRPTFSWNEDDGTSATAYYLQVAEQQSNLPYKVISSATISAPKGQTVVPTTYTLSKDLPKNQQNLYFRVAVKGQTVWNYSDYSGPFTTGTPPSSVSLIGPKSKSVDFTFMPVFSWEPTKDLTNT